MKFVLRIYLQHALEEEVASKVEKLNDIVSGQPTVVKIIVSYNRNGKRQG